MTALRRGLAAAMLAAVLVYAAIIGFAGAAIAKTIGVGYLVVIGTLFVVLRACEFKARRDRGE